jgi:hypothetical protein
MQPGRLRMPSIFIAYRRGDTGWITGRVFDRLQAHFGKFSVFMDVETIPPGLDFRKHIASTLERCKVVVAIVGPQWIGANGQEPPRIFDEDDWVRIEIETALNKGLPIIPVCVDQTPMPKAHDLPASLQPFSFLQASPVDSRRNFGVDTKRLIRAIEQHLGWRGLVTRYALIAILLASVLLLSLLYSYGWLERSSSPSPTHIQARAIQACNVELAVRCAQEGGAFGSGEALAGLRSCGTHQLISSDEPSLQWKDIWTTSVYSYGPQGGGPGGGKDDDVLKVGGWGDWYFTLIRFRLPELQRKPQFAAVALFSKDNEGASVPLAIDRIIHRWDFPKGGTLWWKDRPGHRAITTDPLPAPKREQWYIIEFTALAQEWLDQKSENFGIQIRPAHDFGSFVVFVSSDAPDKSKIPRLIFC